MPPQRSQFLLASNVPHCKLNILVLNFLYIEPDGGDCGQNLSNMQLIENGGFAIKVPWENYETPGSIWALSNSLVKSPKDDLL